MRAFALYFLKIQQQLLINLVGHWMPTWSILQIKEINRDAIN
jgi:hypothetical protein